MNAGFWKLIPQFEPPVNSVILTLVYFCQT